LVFQVTEGRKNKLVFKYRFLWQIYEDAEFLGLALPLPLSLEL